MNHLRFHELHSDIPIFVLRHDGMPIEQNSASSKIFGNEFTNQNLFNFLDPESIEQIQKLFSKSNFHDFEKIKCKIRSGHKISIFTLYFSPLEIGKVLFVQIKNETESIDKQKLYFNAKLVAIGEMAGGIAHEINTPMGVILGSAKIIQDEAAGTTPKIEKIQKNVDRIILSSERITRIVKGLRNVSRNDSEDPITLHSLNMILSDVLALSEEKFKMASTPLIMPPISISSTEQQDFKLPCRPVQVMQVILNLFNNSLDAIQGLEEKWVRLDVHQQSKLIEISITDSGAGIPSNIVDKMMQPFYTTKGIGKGTGLGLSISKSIIEDHGGQFYYDKSSKNTRFVIQLPL